MNYYKKNIDSIMEILRDNYDYVSGEHLIKLILFAYSDAAVTNVVVKVVVSTATSVTALIVATLTILGIVIYFSLILTKHHCCRNSFPHTYST